MLKAILLTGYFLSVPTAMLAPAVFAHRPAPAATNLMASAHINTHAAVLRGSLRTVDRDSARPTEARESIASR